MKNSVLWFVAHITYPTVSDNHMAILEGLHCFSIALKLNVIWHSRSDVQIITPFYVSINILQPIFCTIKMVQEGI